MNKTVSQSRRAEGIALEPHVARYPPPSGSERARLQVR